MKKIIIAWIKKYILKIQSPSSHFKGYKYEYDELKQQEAKDGKSIRTK